MRSMRHRSSTNTLSPKPLAVFCIGIALGASDASAQWPLHYPEPDRNSVRIAKAVRYATADGSSLLMDVYRPANASTPAPAIVFYTLYWPGEGSSSRSSDWYVSWARIAAANGIVAIVPDLRAEPGTGNAQSPSRPLGDDFQLLLADLVMNHREYGLDAERITVFAESGSTWAALPAVQDTAQRSVRAAVLYYGAASVESFRADLPLLWVRAGLDSERTNAAITRLAALAMNQNAPLTLLNHPTGRHGFEGRDDNAVTRAIIEQTLDFVKRATAPAYQAALRKRIGEPAN
jgi:dienelactone hydrolase